MSGNLWLVVTLFTASDTHITVHHSVLGGTAVVTDKRHIELHLDVKVMWKYYKANYLCFLSSKPLTYAQLTHTQSHTHTTPREPCSCLNKQTDLKH